METHPAPDAIQPAEILAERDFLEQQLHAVQRVAQVGVWSIRPPSTLISWSDEACRILGFVHKNDGHADEIACLATIHPDDRQTFDAAIEQARLESVSPQVKFRIVRPDGQVRHIHMQGQLLRDNSGNALLYGTVKDVTEGEQSKAAVREISDRLVDALESMTDAFYTLDKDWRFTYTNKEAERLLQRPRAELLGKVIWNEFRDLTGSTLEHEFRRALEQNRATSFETVYAPLNAWKELRVFPSDEGLAVYFTDITERRLLQKMQRQSEERFKVVAKATSDIIWDWEPDRDQLWWSESMHSAFGYSPNELEDGLPSWIGRVHPDDMDRVRDSFWKAIKGDNDKWSDEYRFMRKDGSYAVMLDHAFFFRDPAGKAIRVIGSFVDITERRQAERDRQQAEARNRMQASLLDKAQDAISVTGMDSRINFWNKGAERLFGWTADEAIGKSKACLLIITHDEFSQAYREVLAHGEWTGDIRKRRKDGSILIVESRLTLVRDDDGMPQAVLEIETDISQRKEAERRIEELAFFDPLTRLPNRRLVLDRLQHALATSGRTRRAGALLFIDLDNFKSLNDTVGHDKGDMLLQQVARRLEACVPRKSDTVARLGGDEFVVMLEDLSGKPEDAAAQAEIIAEMILAAFKRPYQLDGHEHHTTASIGVTLFDNRIGNIDEMLKQADLAMYQAKASGRNAIRFFDPGMQTLVSARVQLEADLRLALLRHEFLLHYQRQTDSSGNTVGAEALLRWRHPERGLISPALFIPLAEETGLILRLGQWVLETACTQLARWATMPATAHLTVAVNVSPRQFRQPEFVEQVLTVLADTGANPAYLKLELTEGLLVANVENVAAKMTALKAKGVGFSLDDFGTGYSSLAYLKGLPLDQLKIDQSFVRYVLTDSNDAAIARTIVALGQTLGLDVIAEGVETQGQRDFLEMNGCHVYQGFLFSQPVPAEHF